MQATQNDAMHNTYSAARDALFVTYWVTDVGVSSPE